MWQASDWAPGLSFLTNDESFHRLGPGGMIKEKTR